MATAKSIKYRMDKRGSIDLPRWIGHRATESHVTPTGHTVNSRFLWRQKMALRRPGRVVFHQQGRKEAAAEPLLFTFAWTSSSFRRLRSSAGPLTSSERLFIAARRQESGRPPGFHRNERILITRENETRPGLDCLPTRLFITDLDKGGGAPRAGERQSRGRG